MTLAKDKLLELGQKGCVRSWSGLWANAMWAALPNR